MWFTAIAILYLIFILIVIFSRLILPDWSDTIKAVIPLATALPAAVLAGVYQRRTSFLQQLRANWIRLVEAFQNCVQLTHNPRPDAADFSSTMKNLSIVIDDFRSIYKNLDEGPGNPGYFPFESLKEIQRKTSEYYLRGDYSITASAATRKELGVAWKKVREPLLKEFDRLEPTHFDSAFGRLGTG
jgi:hypothetical protein